MVVKPAISNLAVADKFESRVILDGSQTPRPSLLWLLSFESRVILDGSQTGRQRQVLHSRFESRVILDGSQTERC